jgi:chromosome segregation ATPase
MTPDKQAWDRQLLAINQTVESLDKIHADHDRSINGLEMRMDVAEKEIEGLRRSRHSASDSLQKHELTLVKQDIRVDTLEKEMTHYEKVIERHETNLNSLTGDVRLLVWKVGLVLGVFLFAANVLTNAMLNR